MQYDEMLGWLRALPKEWRLPIWVISYKRPGTAPLLNRMNEWATASTVNVLVRESQYPDYVLAYPNLTIHRLPDDQIGSAGEARWGAATLALSLGHERIIQMDDDVLSMSFLYEGTMVRGANAGSPKSAATSKTDLLAIPDLEELVMGGFSAVAEEVFDTHEDAMLGGAIKRHMSFDPFNERTKYLLHGGVSPRQMMAWNVARMVTRGVATPPEFYVHGEDIGIVAAVLAADGCVFATPSFAYDHWPESVNIELSVIRDAATAPAMHQKEYEDLLRWPIKDYLKTKFDAVGRPEWNDVSWVKYAKVTGRQRVVVEWGSELL